MCVKSHWASGKKRKDLPGSVPIRAATRNRWDTFVIFRFISRLLPQAPNRWPKIGRPGNFLRFFVFLFVNWDLGVIRLKRVHKSYVIRVISVFNDLHSAEHTLSIRPMDIYSTCVGLRNKFQLIQRSSNFRKALLFQEWIFYQLLTWQVEFSKTLLLFDCREFLDALGPWPVSLKM